MRLNLKVPYAEKDQAKKLGARWDAGRKLWYVEGKADERDIRNRVPRASRPIRSGAAFPSP